MSFPSKFGKYVLLERVNVGGMAEVFKAKTFGVAGFERILAIKRILPNLVEDDEFIRMFIDEARIAVQLNHANIVQIYELGKHGDHYYIAMEYVPSRDLRGILDRLRSSGQLMPIPQAAFITAKVAEGLDYAHKRRDPQGNPMNIIHRDVSPQNILVGYEGEVKVIDFGIAKAANRASKTQAGVLKGKFGYMSPEQVRGLPIDRRSDIFAVGVLLYEMLTGERLFIGESDFSTLERVRNAEVIPPTSFNKKISPQLEQIVLKTLARDVDDRYQWASELAQDLAAFTTDGVGAFNTRRLGASMKEIYAAEVASERSKLEEFLRINPDDIKEKGAPQTSSVLPLPQRQGAPPSPTLSAQAKNKPAARVDEADEGGEEFGEDKTFVIEASAAGLALGQQPTDPKLAQKPRATAPPQQPLITDASADGDVSLYGGGNRDESEEDDARTLVGVNNPLEPPPPVMPAAQPQTARPFAPTRPMVSPGPPSVSDIAPMPAPPPPQRSMSNPAAPRGPIDPVMAAMMEDGVDPASFSAPQPTARLQDVTGPQPVATSMATQEANPFAATPTTPVAPEEASSSMMAPMPVTLAGPESKPNWVPAIAALAASGVLFLGGAAFFAMRLLAEPSEARLAVELVGTPPAGTTVSFNGTPATLPATTELAEGAEVKLVVSGPGLRRFERTVKGTGGRVKQVVLLQPDPNAPSVPETALATATTTTGTGTPPPPVVGGWRLSLAAIAEDGAPVVGAEVLVNGLSVGTTPLEAELGPDLDAVAVRVKKDGFTTSEVELKRGGRMAIGPATVSLKRSQSASTETPEPPTATPPKDPAKDPAKDPPPKDEGKVAIQETPKETPKEQPKETPKEQPKETPKEQPKPAAKVADIQIGTSPFAETTIDGRKYGSTPFFGPRKLTLPVGTHKFEFLDKASGKKYRYQIKIKAPDPNNKVVIQFAKSDPPKVEGQVELKKLD